MSPVLQNDINIALETMLMHGSIVEPIGDNGFYIKRINKQVIYFDAFDKMISIVKVIRNDTI